jgi:integrase/recombinase XerC
VSGTRESPARRLAEQYLTHLAHERRLSANTAAAYRRDLDALLASASETPLERLQVHDIRRFISKLHARGLSPRSLARLLSAWRGLFRYLARDHGFGENPCIGLRAPKAVKRLPNALSPDEAHTLLEAKAEAFVKIRDKAMFELLYSSGLRLSELTGLAPADVDHEEGIVRVTGKGSKTRIVPVGSKAIAALNAWLPLRSQLRVLDHDALFVSEAGRRLGQRSVQLRLKAWALERGVATRVHPHALRHSFASHLLQSSADLRAVQEMLGHASISSTQVYTHLDFQHLAKVYDAAHPRARSRKPRGEQNKPRRRKAGSKA